MLGFVVMTGIIHICDRFDEIPIMDSRGLVKSLIIFLHYYLCLDVVYHL